jgi:hypothetical protein
LQGKALKEIHVTLKQISGEHVLSYATVQNQLTLFERGDFLPVIALSWSTQNPEIIDKIHELYF